MSISALTSSSLVERGVKELKDVAVLAPNFTFNSYATQAANRRSNPQLTLRGIARGGVGLFLNGAPTDAVLSDVGDLDRVEVLRGPQSAYFGRATFAGAVNLVTKTPSSDAFKGRIEATAAQKNWYDLRGSVEGPLGTDKLSFRASARYYRADGQYTNAPDGRNITRQNTNSGSLVLDFHPSDDFNANITTIYTYLHDGPPAYAKFRREDFNCNAGAVPAGQINYYCGELPKYPLNRVGADWPLSPQFQSIFFGNALNFPNNIDNDNYSLTTPGQINKNLQVVTRLNYTMHGGSFLDNAQISYLNSFTGVESESSNNALGEPLGAIPNPNILTQPTIPYISVGAANTPTQNLSYYQGSAYPNFGTTPWEDNGFMYHELRLTSDQSSRLTWMVGGQYSVDHTGFTRRTGISPTGALNLSNTNVTVTKSGGVFASLAYHFTDKLIATAEGRYQIDRITLRNRVPGGGFTTVYDWHNAPVIQRSNTTQFNPRLSLSYAFNPDMTGYASFARGLNPSAFNTALFTVPQSTRDIVKAQTGADVGLKGEQLDMYEVGLKGNLFDGRATFDVDAFYGKWSNQVIQVVVLIPAPNDPTIQTVLRPNANVGRTDLYGLEASVATRITDNLSVNGTLGLVDSTIKDYFCAVCQTSVTGNPNVVGKKTPRVPRMNATLFAEYKNRLVGDMDWYVNGQWIYASKSYVDETNLSWTMPRSTFDFRLGVEYHSWMLEGFIQNAFNSWYYTDASRDTDFANRRAATFNNAIVVGLPDMRRWGFRARYSF